MGLTDVSFQMIGFRVLTLFLVAGVLGFLLAAVAVYLGDKGPRYDGRLSLVPTRHIDLAGAFAMVAFGLGWIRPLDIDARQLKPGRFGIFIVVLAGICGLLVLALLLDALVRPALVYLPFTAGITAAAFLDAAAGLTIWFALFNLLPVPPLAGGLLLEAVGVRVPAQVRWVLTAGLLALVAFGLAERGLRPAYALLAPLLLGS